VIVIVWISKHCAHTDLLHLKTSMMLHILYQYPKPYWAQTIIFNVNVFKICIKSPYKNCRYSQYFIAEQN